MIKVYSIPLKTFDDLLDCSLTDYERKIVKSFKESQKTYSKLTVKKFIYFWLLYNKYYAIESPIQKQIYSTYGLLEESSDAFKERKQQEYNRKKLKRATLEENESEYFKKKGDKYFG
jgi:hypothetical protein